VKWKSVLKPDQSVAIGIGIGVVDLFIFEKALPSMADVRTANPGNTDVETARKQATITAVAVNGLVSVMTRDWNVFLIGGAITASMSWLYVHANAVNPSTGKMSEGTPVMGGSNANSDQTAMYPLPDYGDASAA
jgi:hypothetical protein